MKILNTIKRFLFNNLDNLFYWLRTHTYNRYHIVNAKSPNNDYDWGWIDRSDLILFTSFNILVDFVEKELPYSYGDYSQEPWKSVRQEIQELYTWWTQERPKKVRSKIIDSEDLFTETLNTFIQESKLQEQEDQQYLERLIKIRPHLWT